MRNFATYDVDVHGKSSGVMKTICEKCRPTRRNKRDRSLRVNIDTGHCHCYHCGADFYVPDETEQRERAARLAAGKRRAAAVPQHFHRPVFDPSKTTLSEATERWLVETRCIPQSVIAALNITEQVEFMPQSAAQERCVCFNYFEEGKLINTKFRSGAKHFKMIQGAELIPYNIDSVLGQTSCIIHEGEIDAASSIAAGFKSVISVPAGANANLSWLDRFMPTHFEDLKEIIIAVDADSAGIRLRDELVNRLGAERCRIVVLDPLNRFDHNPPAGQTETQYLSNLLNKFTEFATQYNCLLVLIAHPRKMNRNPLTNFTPRPEMYDINGSADFYNKADYGIVVERDKEVGVTRVHVDKVKFKHLGVGGVATFVYDPVGGRYLPCEESHDPAVPLEKRVRATVYDDSCWLPEKEGLFSD